MSSNNDLKHVIERDIIDLLGLTEDRNSLEYDLNYVIDNGIDKYKEMQMREQEIKDIVFKLLDDRDFLYKLMKILEIEGFSRNCPTCFWNIKKYGKINE